MRHLLQNGCKVINVIFGGHLGDTNQHVIDQGLAIFAEVITTNDVTFQEVGVYSIH